MCRNVSFWSCVDLIKFYMNSNYCILKSLRVYAVQSFLPDKGTFQRRSPKLPWCPLLSEHNCIVLLSAESTTCITCRYKLKYRRYKFIISRISNSFNITDHHIEFMWAGPALSVCVQEFNYTFNPWDILTTEVLFQQKEIRQHDSLGFNVKTIT